MLDNSSFKIAGTAILEESITGVLVDFRFCHHHIRIEAQLMIADGVVDANQFDVALVRGDGQHALFFIVAQQVKIIILTGKGNESNLCHLDKIIRLRWVEPAVTVF